MRKQKGRCTHIKRDNTPVAKTRRVEEFGRGERYVVRGDIQYTAAIILAGKDPVPVQMHRGFRPAGAAGGPEPGGRVVLACPRRFQRWRRTLHHCVPTKVTIRGIAAYDHMFATVPAREGRTKFFKQRGL